MDIIRKIESLLNERIESWANNIESIRKFEKTIGKKATDKGFFDACVSRLSKHMDEETAKGMCATMKDRAYGEKYGEGREKLTAWRGKGKTKKQAIRDVKRQERQKELQ